jgi:hypothetical protein
MTLQQTDWQRRVRRLRQPTVCAQETLPANLPARGVALDVGLHGERIAHLPPDEATEIAKRYRLVTGSNVRHRGTHEHRKVKQGPTPRRVPSDRQQVTAARAGPELPERRQRRDGHARQKRRRICSLWASGSPRLAGHLPYHYPLLR